MGVLPHWNEVVSLNSDLQAGYMLHMYLEKWQFETECDNTDCEGGFVKTEIKDGKSLQVVDLKCTTCSGSGKVSQNPFGIHTVNRDAISSEINPIPPAGYIDKPIEIITKVEERIKAEEDRGLASINMEIVQNVGDDQSGVAKAIDREDLHAFLSRYCRHVFEYAIPETIFRIAMWRYGVTTSDINSILPEINKPNELNVLNLNQLATEYKEASKSNVSAGYLMHLESEIVNRKFANNEDARLMNQAIIRLDPFPGKSIDDLLSMTAMGEKSWVIYKKKPYFGVG